MKSFASLIALVFLLVSCGSINPEAPEIIVQEELEIPPQPVSLIKVPIKVNLKPYFDETNKSVPTKFEGGDHSCDGVSFDYIFKRNPINFEGKGKFLEFEVKGKYSLSLDYCPECTSLFSSKGNCLTPRIYASCGIGEPMRKMYVAYKTEIGVTDSYKLNSTTKLKKVKALSPCKITVFKYNATETLETEVAGALKEVEKDIDKEISSVDLRPDMEETWNALWEPFDLNGYGFMYLKPSEVSVSDIKFKGDTAYFNAFLKASPSVYLDTVPVAAKPLPDLSKFERNNGFDITMDIAAKYDSLSSILSQNLSGVKTEISGKEVIFGDIEVHGAANHRINIKVEFSGSKKGVLYLTGTPVFNEEAQHISFPDLEFDLDTKSALLKSAKWLFDKKITKMVREAASMDLAPYLEDLKSTIDESLNGKIDEGIYMNGKVNTIHINYIYPREDKLFIRLQSTGALGIQM
jgi:hypothetical protein